MLYLAAIVVVALKWSAATPTDIDVQTCITNFDIHRDKIIRTQDSRNMGAKYLNEIDLGTREECLRLCCETDNCDVFVFEEKSSGSCYLFHCGPPEDFKCKFTHHVNYSSAVLAVSRHLPDLESQIKLTKHEQDLNKLRKGENEADLHRLTPSSTQNPATTTPHKSKEVLPPILDEDIGAKKALASSSSDEEVRKCSRYQFECRTSSECIAIYNACDGIPQCADGSDEAPELGCPPDFFTTAPPPQPPSSIIMPNSALMPRYDPNIIASPARLQAALAKPEVYRPPLMQQQPPEMMVQQQQQQNDFLRPRLPYNNNGQYGPVQPVLQPPNWLPAQQPYADKNSQIFTHKENGLQVPDGQENSQLPYDGQVYNPKASNYYQQQLQPVNWGNGGHEELQFPAYPPQIPKTWQPPEQQKEVTYLGHVETKPEQEKMAHELKQTKSMETAPAEPKIKIEKHYVDNYKVDDQADGIAQTPSGAVLSLTLGLIITCILALLIGCRLRVRKRMRKGGKSYAHDADYLVNGMYL